MKRKDEGVQGEEAERKLAEEAEQYELSKRIPLIRRKK